MMMGILQLELALHLVNQNLINIILSAAPATY